jgi:hypothetical protein
LERLAVVQRHPDLSSDRGLAAMELLLSMAQMSGLTESLPALVDRRDWLGELRHAGPQPTTPGRGDEEPQALLTKFVAISKAADQTYLKTGDDGELRRGIEVWEHLDSRGTFAPLSPEALADAYLTVAMLYARRYEFDDRPDDLKRAFRYLRLTETHLIPGSDSDLLRRLSLATWLMLRYERHGDSIDLDQAIDSFKDVLARAPESGEPAVAAAANLGRGLLIRHELSGAMDDVERALSASVKAAGALRNDDPRRRHVLNLIKEARRRGAGK